MTDDNLALEREQEKGRRTLILSDDDDAPGSNAVLRAFVKTAMKAGIHVYGSSDGFAGLIEDPPRIVRLTGTSVRGILPKGGNILGCPTSTKTLGHATPNTDTTARAEDLAEGIRGRLLERKIDTLVLIGGDETLEIGMRLGKMGISVVGIPKSVDNDLGATDVAFGLDTAVGAATRAIDGLHLEESSGDRVMILEVMGRHAGWVALSSGIAGGADAILIPEIQYDIDRIVDKIRSRTRAGDPFSIIVICEGSKPIGGTVSSISHAHEPQRHSGAGAQLARLLEGRIDQEVRVSVLDHLQGGESPSSFDRLLGTRFGVHAAELCSRESSCHLVALRGHDIVAVPLEAAIGNHKRVPPDGELVGVARAIGIEVGAE